MLKSPRLLKFVKFLQKSIPVDLVLFISAIIVINISYQ